MTDRKRAGEGGRGTAKTGAQRATPRRRASGGAGAASRLHPRGMRPHGGHGDFGSIGAGGGSSRPARSRGGTRGQPKKP